MIPPTHSSNEASTTDERSTDPHAEAVERTVDAPGLLPLLPLVLIAWADGDLSTGELETIRDLASEQGWLPDLAREQVRRWLDPGRPPSAVELEAIDRRVRGAASELGRDDRRTLVGLCRELIRREEAAGAPTEAQDEALDRVQELLGLSHVTKTVRLLQRDRPAALDGEPPATVDRAALAAALTARLEGDQQALLAELRARLIEWGVRADPEWDKATYRARVLEWMKRLADAGYGQYGFTAGAERLAQFGGIFGVLATCDLSLTIKSGVHFGLFGGSVYHLGNDAQREELLPQVVDLSLPGCFAMSETGHGSNVRDLETTATYDAETDELVIRTPHDMARKDWIGNAALHGRIATVFAQLEVGEDSHGVHAVLVPIRDDAGQPLPGVRIADCGPKMGLNGIDNGRLWFDDVRVPRSNLLDRYGGIAADGTYSSPIPSRDKRFFTMLGTLVGGRITVARGALAAASVGLAIAVRYGARRRQFGPEGEAETPILDYQSHQRRLMPLLAEWYALHFAIEALSERYAARTPEDAREIEALAAGVKAAATSFANRALRECRLACGGQGYLAENRLPQLIADAEIFATFEGDNTVLLQLVAKGLLTDFRRQFADDRVWSALRYLAGQVGHALSERNPISIRRTDAEHLVDPEFHAAALRDREGALLESVARRLRARIGEGVPPFDAFAACQDHLLTLARAHVETVLVLGFADAVAAAEAADDGTGPALRLCYETYALTRLEAARGWLLEREYIEPAKSKAIRSLAVARCEALREIALPLVDAFAIPDAWMPAIAR